MQKFVKIAEVYITHNIAYGNREKKRGKSGEDSLALEIPAGKEERTRAARQRGERVCGGHGGKNICRSGERHIWRF